MQIYVGKPQSQVDRALKELKGFQKISLQPGAFTKGSIAIDVNSLSYYNESEADWHLEKGDYLIYIGNSSEKISYKIPIKVY